MYMYRQGQEELFIDSSVYSRNRYGTHTHVLVHLFSSHFSYTPLLYIYTSCVFDLKCILCVICFVLIFLKLLKNSHKSSIQGVFV